MALDDAKTDAANAREVLLSGIKQVRARLTATELAKDGRALAKDRAIKLASATIASRKGRPVIALGAVVLGAAYLLRKPIAHAVKSRLGKETTHD